MMNDLRRSIWRFCLVVLLLLIGHTFIYAQDGLSTKTDSLLRVLNTVGAGEARSAVQLELGKVYYKKKEYTTSNSYLQKSLSDIKDEKRIALIRYLEGVNYLGLYDVNKGLQALKASIGIAEKIKDEEILASAYYRIQEPYIYTGNTAAALDNAEKLLALGKSRKDKSLMATAYYYIGMCYLRQLDADKILPNYYKALSLYQETGVLPDIAMMHRNMAAFYIGTGNMDSVAAHIKKAIALYEQLNDKRKLADGYMILANIYTAKNENAEFRSVIAKAYKLAEELGDKQLLAFYGFELEQDAFRSLVRQGKVDSANNTIVLTPEQKKQAEEIVGRIRRNIKIYEQLTFDYSVLSQMYESLSWAEEVTGNYSVALNDYKEATRLNDSLLNIEKNRQFSDIEARYTVARSRDSLQLIEEQKRLKLQKEMELNALKYEFERKRALAKTEEERKRLVLEEALKRKTIENEFEQKQLEARLKYNQDMALVKARQDKQQALSEAELKRANNMRNMSFLGAGLLLLLAGGAVWAYAQKRKDNRRIESEKKKSDDLLLNILPAEVAEELKETGQTKAKHFSQASVLFTDFVNFTKISEQLSAEELVAQLDECFGAFDEIMERNGLEKIKTIGDAYLAVSGIPVYNEHHAYNTVKAGLEIIGYIKSRRAGAHAFEIRIGINSGPLVAGIVGVKKFAYDIWGDTVNTASRMESGGEIGKINVSNSTYELIKDRFACTYRGKINAKNKGEVDMYFVEGLIKT